MIDPAKVAFFCPAELKKFKRILFDRIGERIKAAGGMVVYGDHTELDKLPDDIIPIVGCSPYLKPLVAGWKSRERSFVYWDRGYFLRVFATWLQRGENGGYYRWHRNSFQLQTLRDVPSDRWDEAQRAGITLMPWRMAGKHIVVAEPTPTYIEFHGIEGWTAATLETLSRITDRPIVVRGKESARPLQDDLAGAHCLVAHGSIAAVEAVICGCPVFVHPDSAASLVGLTDLSQIETPIYPDRERWLWSLAFSQFDEKELVDGTLWRLIE